MKLLNSRYNRWKVVLAVFIMAVAGQALLFLPNALAVTPTSTAVRLDRLAKSTATKGLVCVQPSVIGDAEGKLVLTFPAGFTVGASAGWTTSTGTTTGWPSGALAYPSVGTGVAAGQTVTFTTGDITSVTGPSCFNWTSTAALTNPSTTGAFSITVATQTTGAAALESNTVVTSIVDTTGCSTVACDQIAVTASVGQTFTFSLSANAAALGNLSASSPSSATALNAAVTTNAKNGWQMWMADGGGTVGLNSPTASKTIAYSPAVNTAAAALSTGVEGYNIGAGTHTGTCGGTFTYDPNFDDSSATAYKGGGLDATLRTFASATSTASSCAVPLTVSASISNTTPPASDYTSTINVVGAGLF